MLVASIASSEVYDIMMKIGITGNQNARRHRQSLAAANDDKGGCLGDLPPPSPPAEKASTSKDQTGKTGTSDGARHWCRDNGHGKSVRS
jgi:hypothetical protein